MSLQGVRSWPGCREPKSPPQGGQALRAAPRSQRAESAGRVSESPTLGGVGTARGGVLGCEQPPPVGLSTSEVRDPTHTLQSPSTSRARHTLAAATHHAPRAPAGSAQCSGAAGRDWGGRTKALRLRLRFTCSSSSEANTGQRDGLLGKQAPGRGDPGSWDPGGLGPRGAGTPEGWDPWLNFISGRAGSVLKMPSLPGLPTPQCILHWQVFCGPQGRQDPTGCPIAANGQVGARPQGATEPHAHG